MLNVPQISQYFSSRITPFSNTENVSDFHIYDIFHYAFRSLSGGTCIEIPMDKSCVSSTTCPNIVESRCLVRLFTIASLHSATRLRCGKSFWNTPKRVLTFVETNRPLSPPISNRLFLSIEKFSNLFFNSYHSYLFYIRVSNTLSCLISLSSFKFKCQDKARSIVKRYFSIKKYSSPNTIN